MIPIQNAFIKYRVINGQKYIAKNYEAFQLDEVGEIIWESIDGKTSIDDIAMNVSRKYEVEYEIVLKDVKNFINELLENKLIEETHK